jgi:hypothetical protein
MKRLSSRAISLVALIAIAGCGSNPSKTPDTPSTPAVNQVTATDEASTNQASTDQASTDREETAPVGASPPVTGPMPGFILLAPLRSTETYLLNADKQVVHRWNSKYPPAASVYLLENGDLLRTARDPDFTHFKGGGIGGILERFNWEGELIWSFNYANEAHCAHHDVAALPNGNILMIAWERKSKDEAIAQGRDASLLKDDLWPDFVIEVQPDDPTDGKIVWEWHMWDHLVQDFDREKPNYGVVYEHPELIDLNNTGSTPPATPEELRKLRAVGYTGGGDDDKDKQRRGSSDWMHTNSINYNPQLDQIALSAKSFSEIWIIDHSTTRDEAASHRGGRQDRGGDLLYRWGNPWAYKSGTKEDKKLFDQHDVRWIPRGLPGAGHLTAFNNGQGREFSSIIEIELPRDADGQYVLDDEGRFGPQDPAWEYTAENKKDFYSGFISGATRLPNGNTMICEGATGRFFEVDREGTKLWEHINTLGGELTMEGRPNDAAQEARRLLDAKEKKPFVENNALFRVTKLAPDYRGLAGRKLAPLAEQPVPFADLVQVEVARLKAADVEKAAAETATAGEDGVDQKSPEAGAPKKVDDSNPAGATGKQADETRPAADSPAPQ